MRAFCRSDPTVRLVSLEIFATGSFCFEYCRSSASKAFVQGWRFFADLDCFVFFVPDLLVFLAIEYVLFKSLRP